MAYEGDHGGGCCGMSHISEFDIYADSGDYERGVRDPQFHQDIDEENKEVERIVGRYRNDRKFTHLYEIVLTTDQMYRRRMQFLQALGFRRVNRFKNSNSGNICHVFHLVTGEGSLQHRTMKG